MILHIDTQKIYHALVAGGFTEQQAETVIETMRNIDLSHLATKDDVQDATLLLKQDIVEVRTELKQDIAEVRTELK